MRCQRRESWGIWLRVPARYVDALSTLCAPAHSLLDGQWIYEVIDDKLYLVQEDFHMSYISRKIWEDIDMPDRDEKYRQAMQKGSDALYFAKCRNPNATWLPLLEKAYAKAHGDYGSIRGGVTG